MGYHGRAPHPVHMPPAHAQWTPFAHIRPRNQHAASHPPTLSFSPFLGALQSVPLLPSTYCTPRSQHTVSHRPPSPLCHPSTHPPAQPPTLPNPPAPNAPQSVPLLPSTYFVPGASLHAFLFFVPTLIAAKGLRWRLMFVTLFAGPILGMCISRKDMSTYALEW